MVQKLCCPQCGNEELQVATEVNVQTTGSNYSGGKGCLGFLLFGPLGLLCGSCGQGQRTRTTNTNYWMCPKCGQKFRNPEELRIEAEKQKRVFILMSILAIAGFASLTILACVADVMGIAWLGLVVGGIVFALGYAFKVQERKLKKEADETDQKMLNFQRIHQQHMNDNQFDRHE